MPYTPLRQLKPELFAGKVGLDVLDRDNSSISHAHVQPGNSQITLDDYVLAEVDDDTLEEPKQVDVEDNIVTLERPDGYDPVQQMRNRHNYNYVSMSSTETPEQQASLRDRDETIPNTFAMADIHVHAERASEPNWRLRVREVVDAGTNTSEDDRNETTLKEVKTLADIRVRAERARKSYEYWGPRLTEVVDAGINTQKDNRDETTPKEVCALGDDFTPADGEGEDKVGEGEKMKRTSDETNQEEANTNTSADDRDKTIPKEVYALGDDLAPAEGGSEDDWQKDDRMEIANDETSEVSTDTSTSEGQSTDLGDEVRLSPIKDDHFQAEVGKQDAESEEERDDIFMEMGDEECIELQTFEKHLSAPEDPRESGDGAAGAEAYLPSVFGERVEVEDLGSDMDEDFVGPAVPTRFETFHTCAPTTHSGDRK